MTNREWLNNLSNEDLINWIYTKSTYRYDFEKQEWEFYATNYAPCFAEIVRGCTNGKKRLKEWLEEERNEKQIH